MPDSQHPYGISFQNVWKTEDEAIIKEIIELWTSNNLLPEGSDPAKRAKQVVFVIRSHENKIIGISTAFPEYIKQLRNHAFLFRCFILPEHRYPGLLTKLTVITRDFLQSIFEETDPPCIGMISIIQNERLNEYNKPWYKGGDMVFIGYTQDGLQMRMFYFDGATI